MFKHTSNRLPNNCNRLHHFEINWNVVNSVESFLKTIFATGNRLPESKNSLVKGFVKNSCATQCFEKLFSTYLD